MIYDWQNLRIHPGYESQRKLPVPMDVQYFTVHMFDTFCQIVAYSLYSITDPQGSANPSLGKHA